MEGKPGFTVGRPNFVGIVFYDKNGKGRLVKCTNEQVKKEVEDLYISKSPYLYTK